MRFIALLRVCFQCFQSVNAAVQPPRRPLGSETRSSSAQLALLVSTRTAFAQMLILKTWPPNMAAAAKNLRFLPVLSAALQPSGVHKQKRRRSAEPADGCRCAGCCRTQRGRKRRLDLRLVRKPASPLRAAGGQGSCVGLSLILRRGRTTVAPRIVPEPLQQRTDSQLLFSLMGFFKPRSHLNN